MDFAERMSGGVRLRAARLALCGDDALLRGPASSPADEGFGAACGGGQRERGGIESGSAAAQGGWCACAYDGLLALLQEDRGSYRARRLASLVSFVLGNRCTVGSASGFIYVFARSLGYDIPPYPLAGSGEIRAFFRDEGVANVPEWYATIGIGGDDYAHLHEKTAIVVRGGAGVRTLFVLDGVLFSHDKAFSRFVTLEESGIACKLPESQLAQLLAYVLDAALMGYGQAGAFVD